MKMLAVEMSRAAFETYMKHPQTKSKEELIRYLDRTSGYLGKVVDIYIVG